MRFDIRPEALPAITGLFIEISGKNVRLAWDSFEHSVHIYGAVTNNRSHAYRIGTAAAGTREYTHLMQGNPVAYYYWVIALDALNREVGAWQPSASNAGITLPVIAIPGVTGLSVTPGLRANQLNWDGPFNYPVAVYASITTSLTTATKVGIASAGTSGYTHVTGVPTVWYYWVRALDWLNREAGEWNPSSGGGLVAVSQLAIDLDIAAGAVKASNLAVAAISSTTGELNSNTVSAINIAAGAVTASKTAIAAISSSTGNLTANSVTSANIVAGTITSSNIAAGTITANNILGSTITGNKIAAGTITAGNIQAYSITADRIQSNSITAAQISAGYVYAGTIAANKISAGTLTGMSIVGGTLSINNGAFAVSTAGVVTADNLFTNHISAESSTYGGNAITGVCWNVNGGLGIQGRVAYNITSSNAHAVGGVHSRLGTSGLIGVANGYDFYANGSGVNYGPFTGAHDALVANPDIDACVLGDIVIDKAVIVKNGLSNVLFEVEPSSVANQKAAVGVIARISGSLREHEPAALIESAFVNDFIDREGNREALTGKNMLPLFYEIRDDYSLIAINALGEGQMNVCGEGGNIEAGDLIVTSSLAGKGMRQADDIVRGYTVAKARESVEFATSTEVKLVACIYLCG